MILKEEDIINAIESYRNSKNWSQEKMASVCGMNSKSVYNDWINKKRKGKLLYLLEYLNNTNTDINSFTDKFENQNNKTIESQSSKPILPLQNQKCTNIECQELLNDLLIENRDLFKKLCELKKEKIEWLTKYIGEHGPGEKLTGSMEKPRSTG